MDLLLNQKNKMKNCNNEVKSTCTDKSYATCIYYELDVPEYSSLKDLNCTTLEETTKETYDLITKIKSETDLSSLGEACLEYVKEAGILTVKSVLLTYEEEICALKEKVRVLEEEAICDKNIEACLDLTGLTDQCDTPVTTLKQLLEYLITATTPTP